MNILPYIYTYIRIINISQLSSKLAVFFAPQLSLAKKSCGFFSIELAGKTCENEATAIAAAVVDESEASTFENEAPPGKAGQPRW